MKCVLIAYVPVLHKGYASLFAKHAHAGADSLFIFGEPLLRQEAPDLVRKDIRALDADLTQKAIESWGIFREVKVADYSLLVSLASTRETKPRIIFPEDDLCRALAEKYFIGFDIEFNSVFLRWDQTKSVQPQEIAHDLVISVEQFGSDIIAGTQKLAQKSSDWWRQIGAVVIRDENVILSAYNKHVPSPHTPYFDGDPRANFKRGVANELATALHADQALFAEAVRKGISFAEARIYVTTFPCPPCAKLIAYSGITHCYFSEGYSLLDAETILKTNDVKIVLVK